MVLQQRTRGERPASVRESVAKECKVRARTRGVPDEGKTKVRGGSVAYMDRGAGEERGAVAPKVRKVRCK